MTAALILNFAKIRTLGHVTVGTNVYPTSAATNFYAHIFIRNREMTTNPNPIWRPPPSWISNDGYFGHRWRSYGVANIYLQTKFSANRSRSGWDIRISKMRWYVFPRWRPSAILDLLFPVLDHPRSLLDGLCLSCQQRNDPIWWILWLIKYVSWNTIKIITSPSFIWKNGRISGIVAWAINFSHLPMRRWLTDFD